nr:ycf49-like protein [Ipomoea batatas]
MAVLTLLSPSKFLPSPKPKQTQLSSVPKSPNFISSVFHPIPIDFNNQKTVTTLLGVAGLALIAISGPASAAEQAAMASSSVQFAEPANALSLPTWTIHVSSVVEWYRCWVEHFVPAHGISSITQSLSRRLVQKRRGGEEDEEIEVMNLELYLKNISMMKENEMLRKKANLLHQENLALLSLFQQSDSAAAAVASPESFLTFC